MPLPKTVTALETVKPRDALSHKVGDLTIGEIENMSIADISKLRNPVLRDLLNDAIRNRLAFHVGGSYTTAPALTLRESAKATARRT